MEKKSPKDRMIMALGDEALDGVTGGTAGNGSGVPTCPLCSSPAAKYICENLQCRNYGSYIIPYAKIRVLHHTVCQDPKTIRRKEQSCQRGLCPADAL